MSVKKTDTMTEQKTHTFQPTVTQVEYLKAAIKLGTYANKSAIAQEADVRRENWYDWMKVPGFIDWFKGEFNEAIKAQVWELDAIGWEKARKDFRYWEAMQKKYGGLKEKPVVDQSTHYEIRWKANENMSLLR